MGTITLTTSPLVDMLMEHKDQHGMSDRDLAEAIGVSHGSPSNWRRGGKVDLDLAKIQRIAKMLDIEDWKVPVLAYGLDGPGPDTGSVAGTSPRSAKRPNGATHLAKVFTMRPDPAHTPDQPAMLQATGT